MKKAKSTWKPFEAKLNGRTTYEFNCDTYIPVSADDIAIVTKRWGDILDIQEMTPDEAVEQGGIVEAPIIQPTKETDGYNS